MKKKRTEKSKSEVATLPVVSFSEITSAWSIKKAENVMYISMEKSIHISGRTCTRKW